RVERELAAGIDLLGSALPQIILAGGEQLAGDVAALLMRSDQQQAGRALTAIEIAVRTVRPKARMDEAHQPRTVAGDDQALAIEPWFGQDVLFEELRSDGLNSPADRSLGPPDFGQPRRISILEWAVANQA